MRIKYLIPLEDLHKTNRKINLAQKCWDMTHTHTTEKLHMPQMKNGHLRLLSRATSDSRLYRSAVFNCQD